MHVHLKSHQLNTYTPDPIHSLCPRANCMAAAWALLGSSSAVFVDLVVNAGWRSTWGSCSNLLPRPLSQKSCKGSFWKSWLPPLLNALAFWRLNLLLFSSWAFQESRQQSSFSFLQELEMFEMQLLLLHMQLLLQNMHAPPAKSKKPPGPWRSDVKSTWKNPKNTNEKTNREKTLFCKSQPPQSWLPLQHSAGCFHVYSVGLH